jgi:hypothetical protein
MGNVFYVIFCRSICIKFFVTKESVMIGFVSDLFRIARKVDLSLAFEEYTKTVKSIDKKKKPVLEDKIDQSEDSEERGDMYV